MKNMSDRVADSRSYLQIAEKPHSHISAMINWKVKWRVKCVKRSQDKFIQISRHQMLRVAFELFENV